MSLNATQPNLKRRDTETTNEEETDANTPLKSLPFSWLPQEDSEIVQEWLLFNKLKSYD